MLILSEICFGKEISNAKQWCQPIPLRTPTARRFHKPDHDFPNRSAGVSGALQLHHPILRQNTLSQAHRCMVCRDHHFLLPNHRASDANQRHFSQQPPPWFRLQDGVFARPAE